MSRLARSQVTVSLSGDGGDELFAGYNRHAWLPRLQRRSALLPAGARRRIGTSLARLPPGAIDRVAALNRLLPKTWHVRNPSDKVVKLGRVLAAGGVEQAYQALVSHWDDAESMVLGPGPPGDQAAGASGSWGSAPGSWGSASGSWGSAPGSWPALGGVTEQVLWLDLVGYLPDDILTKLDRASMAVSLESRVPFLDRQVLDLAWRLPLSAKLHDGVTKAILRTVLHRHVPAALVDRPKMGFGLPIGSWLRGPLRPWAEELLARRRLCDEGILDPDPIRRAWEAHQSGRRDVGYALWDVLMLEAWLDRWMP